MSIILTRYTYQGQEPTSVKYVGGEARVDPGDIVCKLDDGSVVGVPPKELEQFESEHTEPYDPSAPAGNTAP